MLYLVDIFVSYSPPLFPLAGGLRVLHRRHHHPHQIHIMLDLYVRTGYMPQFIKRKQFIEHI
jgi:hypothetical protein